MADADPARPLHAAGRSGGELAVARRLRACAGAACARRGLCWRLAFAAFWGIAALVVIWEWTVLVSGDDRRSVAFDRRCSDRAGGGACSIAQSAETDSLRPIGLSAALIIIAMGMFAVAIIAPAGRGAWLAAGIPYAGAVGLAPIVLRADDELWVRRDHLAVRGGVGHGYRCVFRGPRHWRPEARATLQPEQDLVGCARRPCGGYRRSDCSRKIRRRRAICGRLLWLRSCSLWQPRLATFSNPP